MNFTNRVMSGMHVWKNYLEDVTDEDKVKEFMASISIQRKMVQKLLKRYPHPDLEITIWFLWIFRCPSWMAMKLPGVFGCWIIRDYLRFQLLP